MTRGQSCVFGDRVAVLNVSFFRTEGVGVFLINTLSISKYLHRLTFTEHV
jgi:hypothetical protein